MTTEADTSKPSPARIHDYILGDQIVDIGTGIPTAPTEVIEPGLVDVHEWRPDDDSGRRIGLRVVGGGVGRIV
ncbi:hypothetical protein ACU635_21645 [[Actinomadura] parvosata]|uniref:hypothetical protein n=1 Tax=[Actinomadura] parvosata TaxID=1955412 RepID=UPI00406CAEC9